MTHDALVSVEKPTNSNRTRLKVNMKNIILCTFFMAMCLLVETKGSEKRLQNQCARVTHHSDGHITAVGCGTYACAKGKHIGYRPDDLSKPYPECCGGPICKD